MTEKYHLYFDDTGSRDPDKKTHPAVERDDKMDCFALGGVLIKEQDIDTIFREHKAFCSGWNIDYPLHSQPIRGGRGNFGWLKKPDTAYRFLTELEEFLLSLPIIGIASVIHRSGYNSRYKTQYDKQLWPMCKTTYSILIERAAKFADQQDCKLEIYYEGSGRKEDRDIIRYARGLKKEGTPFDKKILVFTRRSYRKTTAALFLANPTREQKKHQ